MAEKKTKKASVTVTQIKEDTAADYAVARQSVKGAEPESPVVPKNVDPSTIILVKNGFQGKLIYKSTRTGETFIWDHFGDEQEMELRELRNVKSSASAFFSNNWFMFDKENDWVIPYLGIGRYYKNAVKIEDFDEIFTRTPEEVLDIVGKMSDGQKRSLSYRALQLIADGEIDSRKVIAALEEALGMELIEK